MSTYILPTRVNADLDAAVLAGELTAVWARRIAEHRERETLAEYLLTEAYDGPETPNGSAIAMVSAVLAGEPNALHVARGQWDHHQRWVATVNARLFAPRGPGEAL